MKGAIVCILLFFSISIFAQVDPVDQSGLAIGGYDVVAYQKMQKAVKGSSSFKSMHEGVTYLFSSTENQQLFVANPAQFVPAYGGYCALAVSYGKKISVDPETFKVVDGRLFLFFHGKSGGRIVNSRDAWNKNEERLLKKADDLWPDVKKKTYKSTDTLN